MRHTQSTFIRSSTLLALSAIALASQMAIAQTAPQIQDAARQGDLLLRQEQERLRFEQERARRLQAPSGVDLKQALPRADASKAAGACHNVSVISLKGAEWIDEDDQQALTSGFKGRCLGVPDIEKLMGQVTQHYMERGFSTTRAYLPAQDLSRGKLELLVVEGRIERLVVDGDPENRVNLAMTVPARAGDLLNIRDLEQAVDQINSVSANKVKLDILPGSAPGKSVVMFRNVAGNPVGLQLSADNQGSAATGRNSASATVTMGGLLGLNENISFTYRSSTPHDAAASSDSTSLGLTIPSGYATYGASVSVSNYSTGLVTDTGLKMVSNGQSTTMGLTAERVIARDQDSRHSVTAALTSTEGKNFLDTGNLHNFLQVSSRRATSLAAGLKSTQTLGGGMLSLKPEVVVGLNDMGNLPTGVNAASTGPQAEFTKVTADVNYDKRFELLTQDWGWTSVFKGQYSASELLGSQQILIGGIPSIRGFVTNVISGDSGYYWRNELALHKQLDLGGTAVKAKLYAGYDTGYVSSHSTTGGNGRLSGVVMGLSTQIKAATVDLSWTRANSLPDGMTREAAQTWVRVSFSL